MKNSAPIVNLPIEDEAQNGEESQSTSNLEKAPNDDLTDGLSSIRESETENENENDNGVRESDIDDRSAEKLEAMRAKRKRRAVLNKDTPVLEKEENVYETDPSKLRPPSYTDRILVHSLPDRSNRVTIQAYDFCDTLRVSDHRAVSMTLLLEVNSNVVYDVAADAALAVTSNRKEDKNTAQKEPQFELYELIITELSVIILDLKFEEDEEDESTKDPNDALADDLKEVRHVSMKKQENFEEFNPMFQKSNSPKANRDSKKKKGGIKFSEEAINPNEHLDIEMQSVDPHDPKVLEERNSASNRPISGKTDRKKSMFSKDEKKLSVGAGKKNRKKSIFAVFFSTNEDDEESDAANQNTKDNATEIEDEDAILKDMARESLDWKNTLHQPGEWRKRVLEEQRKEKEREKQSVALTSSTALPIKKKHKSDEKMIHLLTVVFPLPSKDPLLVYRRLYDYSQAFDIDDKSQKAFDRNE